MKQIDFGKPMYNLEILLSLSKTSFDNQSVPAIEQIQMYGNAIGIAKKLFSGYKIVTEKGYLLNGLEKNLEIHKVDLDIDDNVSALIILDKIIQKEIADNDERPYVHFHSLNSGMERIRYDEGHLYLQDVRTVHEINSKMNKLFDDIDYSLNITKTRRSGTIPDLKIEV